MQNRKDYYQILGVDQAASAAEIQAAWRRKAKELHPDRLRQASEAIRSSAEESLKQVNIAYGVLGNEERRRKYDADWRLINSPPQPVVVPSVIVFNDAVPGEGKIGSFVIRNDGGPYNNIWFSDPDSWVRVTGYASVESEDELPLRVEITATGWDWGRHYAESITVRLDDVEVAVRVRLHTKPAPASHSTRPAAATPQPAGSSGWGMFLGFAAVFAVIMMIVANVNESAGEPTNTSGPPAVQPWSSGSNYLGAPTGSNGSRSGFPGQRPGKPLDQFGFPEARQGLPGSLLGNPMAQPSAPGFQPRSPVMQPRSSVIQPGSGGHRPSSFGMRNGSQGFRPSTSGYQSSSPSFGGWR
ncbi:MAG: J domain-containing protein [Dehalococcoidia bacterium]